MALKRSFPEVAALLASGLDTKALRARLVAMVSGLGYKEASHFLRNIGRTDLVIVDRHIIRNFVRMGIIAEAPSSISTRKYLELEKLFEQLAGWTGIHPDELDLVLWSRETGKVLK
jgi:N-glycosylase/DNA lyase